MKLLFLLLAFLLMANVGSAQQTYVDSLHFLLNQAKKEDTTRVLALCSLADYYGFIQSDSCFYYASQATRLSEKLKYSYGEYWAHLATFHGFNTQGNYPKALQAALDYLRTAEDLKTERPEVMSQAFYTMGLLNREMANYEEAKLQFHKEIQWQKSIGQPMEEVYAAYAQMGIVFSTLKHLDSALWYAEKGYTLGLHSTQFKKYFALAISALGNIYLSMGNFKMADKYFRDAVHESVLYNNTYFEVRNYNNLATLFNKTNERDSCIYYAGKSLLLSQQHHFAESTYDASNLLTKTYESVGKPDSTLKYIKIMLAAKDSVFSQAKGQQFRQLAFDAIMHQQDIDKAKERYQYKVRSFILLTALSVFLLLALIFYLNARQKQKSKIKIENAFKELKATQSQLIQSEKMASLGELTAGIAHEIQNPLNFVNNFSEVNSELIEEMKEEISRGNLMGVKTIADNIDENEKKISHHGKRADAIVKGMLQHSQTSAGKKEPADINILADEYLRLAYHGLRAKEKSFNSIMRTDYDESIGRINIIPQDIGRVLLNLYSNAFYAVTEKKRQQDNRYEPTVTVQTKRLADKIYISIKDNGDGIPPKVISKIFHPFFTTKPTGQGTGLGLSLSYDIIQAHGGELKVHTREGEGAEFIVVIPAA
ncbi:MAG TPA: ATP-binding protein [Puia sp.]|nr:ATP-binding protein [Puia sp.]